MNAAGTPHEQPRQGEDGHPHMTWFNRRTQASFVWDGESQNVEVSIGGYGEPVDHYITAPGHGRNHSPMEVLNLFEQRVRAYNETLPDY